LIGQMRQMALPQRVSANPVRYWDTIGSAVRLLPACPAADLRPLVPMIAPLEFLSFMKSWIHAGVAHVAYKVLPRPPRLA
jgi:hypothetical protein